MKPENYAQALMYLLKAGKSSQQSVAAVHDALVLKGRSALMPHIGRAFARLAARESSKERNVLLIAHAKDEHDARKASGASDATVIHDVSLIGGWRLERVDMLIDKSWKQHLLAMYNNVTRA